MMNSWVRLWHDMPTDPKWRVIARKSGQSIGNVIAVFNFVMVNASDNRENRGHVKDLESDELAAALDISPEDVESILAAMQGKVLDGEALTGWEKRQPKREDSESAKRVTEWRKRNVTQCNAVPEGVTQGNATTDIGNALKRQDSDSDSDSENSKASSPAKPALVPRREKRPEKPPLSPDQQVWFDKTWLVFWKKVSKSEAKEAYGKWVTTQEMADKVHAAILLALPFMNARELDRQPHFASWLNGERWEDEYSGASGGGIVTPPPFDGRKPMFT